jgi:DNA-binding CsgD family transcriptional regulator
MEVNWLDLIDAAYRMDRDDGEWLSSVMAAAAPMLSRNLGTVGVLYDASEAGVFLPQHLAIVDMPPEINPDLVRETLEVSEEGAPFVQKLFGQVQCALVSKTFARCFPKLLPYTTEKRASPDILAVNGTDPTLRGCILTANSPDHSLDRGTQLFWSRLATHVAAAYRLRRRLRGRADQLVESAEAVLTPDARLLHASELAQGPQVRELLSNTVRVQERLRIKKHREDPEAVGDWKGLVDARWSLVEHVDTDGKRMIVAQPNESASKTQPELSPREREVLAYAVLGHSNKVIAYELGLAHSTVRVLLARASSKLGAHGRKATLDQFRRVKQPKN